MSKATFYEHFDNKEDCIIALHDAATSAVLEAMRRTGEDHAGPDAAGRVRAVIHTFLEVLAAFPDEAQTLLVEIIGAGPRAMERRDRVVAEYAAYIDEVNREDAERYGVAAARLAARRLRDRRRGDRARLAPDPHGRAGGRPRPRAGRRAARAGLLHAAAATPA